MVVKFGRWEERWGKMSMSVEQTQGKRERAVRGGTAVEQARLFLLLMINIAQLWILASTVEAALAQHRSVLIPLVVASAVCWLVTISILLWWRPASRRHTSSGYIRTSAGNRIRQ